MQINCSDVGSEKSLESRYGNCSLFTTSAAVRFSEQVFLQVGAVLMMLTGGFLVAVKYFKNEWQADLGSSMIEIVLVLPVTILAITSLLAATQLFLVGMKTEQAAIFGAVSLYQAYVSGDDGGDPGAGEKTWSKLRYSKGEASASIVEAQQQWLQVGSLSNGWSPSEKSHRIGLNALMGLSSFLGIGASPPAWEEGKSTFSSVHPVTMEPKLENTDYIGTDSGTEVPTHSQLSLRVSVPIFDALLKAVKLGDGSPTVTSRVRFSLPMAAEKGGDIPAALLPIGMISGPSKLDPRQIEVNAKDRSEDSSEQYVQFQEEAD